MKELGYKTAFSWGYQLTPSDKTGTFANVYNIVISLPKREKTYLVTIAKDTGKIARVNVFEKGSKMFAVVTPKNGLRMVYALDTINSDVNPLIGKVPTKYAPMVAIKWVVEKLGLGKEKLSAHSQELPAGELEIEGGYFNPQYIAQKLAQKAERDAVKGTKVKRTAKVNDVVTSVKTQVMGETKERPRSVLSSVESED